MIDNALNPSKDGNFVLLKYSGMEKTLFCIFSKLLKIIQTANI
jgi:hypothetical protein